MAKTITIPHCRNPFRVIIGAVEYSYPAGSTVEVPDAVAAVIEHHVNLQPKEDPNAGKVTGGVNKLPQVVDRTVTELTAEDLQGATEIGAYAFHSCKNMNSVSVPEGVTKINQNAFGVCIELRTIILPSTLTDIATSVFSSSQKVEKIVLKSTTPPSVKSTSFRIQTQTLIIVPDGTEDAYKNSTNWSSWGENIVEESNIPTDGDYTIKLGQDGVAVVRGCTGDEVITYHLYSGDGEKVAEYQNQGYYCSMEDIEQAMGFVYYAECDIYVGGELVSTLRSDDVQFN